MVLAGLSQLFSIFSGFLIHCCVSSFIFLINYVSYRGKKKKEIILVRWSCFKVINWDSNIATIFKNCFYAVGPDWLMWISFNSFHSVSTPLQVTQKWTNSFTVLLYIYLLYCLVVHLPHGLFELCLANRKTKCGDKLINEDLFKCGKTISLWPCM